MQKNTIISSHQMVWCKYLHTVVKLNLNPFQKIIQH